MIIICVLRRFLKLHSKNVWIVIFIFSLFEGEFQHSPVTVHQTNTESIHSCDKEETCSIDKPSDRSIDVTKGSTRVSFDLEKKAGGILSIHLE